jgi:dihydrofolate synthase/folylpolyglutamate synthase
MVLSGLNQHRWSLGLERTARALDILQHPERSYRQVLVAGTNGKGSTCVCLERIITRAGLKVGTTLSPHVSRFTERFRIGGVESDAAELARMRHELEPELSGLELTYFEWCVILAVVLFQRKNVDVGIFEVGLGGRYDASNVLDPVISLITSISEDHTDYLGNTVAAIAAEKACIARPGAHLLTSADGEALEVIREHARRVGAVLHEVGAHGGVPEAPSGPHQTLNASLALAAARLLGVSPTETEVRHALRTAFLPGRIEGVGGRVIMDVAHNAASMLVLVEHLKARGFTGAGVAGILADKDYGAMVSALAQVCSRIFVAPVHSPRSWGTDEMSRVQGFGAVTVCGSVTQAFQHALQTGQDVVVTGSFYTVGEVRESLICRGWPTWA